MKKMNTGSASNNSSDDIKPLAEGEYEARLVYVADLGLQTGAEWKGVKKADAQQYALGLELAGEVNPYDEAGGAMVMYTAPFNVYSSLIALAKEYKFAKVFDPTVAEGDEFDWSTVLDMPCTVVVKHNKAGYANIADLTPIPKKYQASHPPSTIEPATGDAENDNNVVTKSLYGLTRWVHDRRLDPQESMHNTPSDMVDDVPF